ncbi:hypothetical protein AWH48_11275 [Domibacillus aminovorans]|uniref:MBL fold metallo-hydrolase n=1 Tax=Domibacillus aminovorans TaxID=29332 RepID=A0A177KLJ4_9BACI|nr:S-layer homology domain-containing protein [Domibacillus aminovorans]OAH53846.1 hypothetical protein AWH48_11275 [Domibacillus aminovorans]
MKKTLAFLSSAVLALGIAAPFAEAASFKDVPDSYRFYEEIDYLSDAEIITGFPDGSFKPDQAVTRAQAAILIGKTFELDGKKRKTSFSDVNSSNTASGYIESAVDEGIISGFPDGTFRPGQTVSRGQLAILLTRGFELSDSASVTFKDVSPSSAAYPYIGKIIAAGITAGYPDNTYRPDTAVTRGQFAAFMSRAIDAADTDPVPEGPALFVDFLNVGQGDAILLGFPNGQTMLVDAGRSDAAIKEAVAGFGPGFTVDTFVATHPDADHIGGADAVIKDFGVKTVIDSGQDHTTNTYLDYLAAIQASGAAFKVAQEGQDISPDPSVSVKVLHVDSEAADLNDGSIVLMVSYGETDYLLTGDAGIEVEKELVAQYDLDAEVLKVSHHGSDTGTSEAFLNAVNPIHAILSYGEGNQYGHPTSDILKRLFLSDADVWSTSEGDIETWTDGTELYIEQGIDGEPTQNDSEQEPVTDNGRIEIVSKDLGGETVGIKNSGFNDVDLSSWTLVSVQGNQTYTFPDGYVLGAGKTIYVTSGPNAKEQQPTYLKWTTSNIWLNSGDPARLYDEAGEIVSAVD